MRSGRRGPKIQSNILLRLPAPGLSLTELRAVLEHKYRDAPIISGSDRNAPGAENYRPGPQDCLHASCWLLQFRLQDGLAPPGTHAFWQFMTCVSQLVWQAVNADADGSNWGRGGTNG